MQIISKITLPEGTVLNELPNNEITDLINFDHFMSVEHMVYCLSPYSTEFLLGSRAGIKKRRLTRYDEALTIICKERGIFYVAPLKDIDLDEWFNSYTF
jgi:hypothetical protein